MSYILDALKKAEHQRDIGQVPSIASEHQSKRTTPVSRWVFALLFVLGINAGLLVYILWPDSASFTRLVSPSSTAGGAQPAPTPAVNPPVVPSRVDPVAAPPVTSPSVSEVSKPAPPPAVPLRPLPALPPLPEPAKKVLVETPDVTDSGATTTVADQVATAAPVAAAPATGPNDNLPVWPQVSSQLFREINSSLRLDVHVYSEHPQERFILINLQKYNEGEQLQEGPVVDEITPVGVIFSFRGQRFRVQAQ